MTTNQPPSGRLGHRGLVKVAGVLAHASHEGAATHGSTPDPSDSGVRPPFTVREGGLKEGGVWSPRRLTTLGGRADQHPGYRSLNPDQMLQLLQG